MFDIKILRIAIIISALFAGLNGYSQGNSNCSNPTPFCTGTPMTFPASTQAGNAQSGPSYGCLGGQPNPAWFFMQMATTGSMVINISATNDVDFICWGPFTSLTANGGACSNLTSANQVPVGGGSNGCSFSASATETCIIANAVAGQFYVLLVTNWSNSVQNINLTQTNNNTAGAGTTNCGIICTVTPVNSGPICPGGTATISATTGTSTNSYTWTGTGVSNPGSLSNVITNIQTSTTYTFKASTSTGTCQATTVVTVVPLPSYVVSPATTTVCQNGSYVVAATSTNPSAYTYQWLGPVNFNASNQAATYVTVPPITVSTATLTYTVVVTPTALNCPLSTVLTVQINNPPTPTLSLPGPLCNTSTLSSVTATPGAGTWYGNQIVSANGIVTPNQATSFGNFPVCYSITIGSCTASACGSISVSQYNTAAFTGTMPNRCVQDAPFNLMTIVSNTNGIWSGVNVSGNTFSTTTTSGSLPTGAYVLTYYNSSTPFAYPPSCQASNSIVVNVFNPPTPTISPIMPKCTNAATLALGVAPTGGTWSGNTGISPGGIYTPGASANTAGSNTVTYTAGQGTCVASSSAVFNVSQFRTAAISINSLSLCYNTNLVNLMSLVSSTVSGAWRIQPNYSANLAGTYSLNPAGSTYSFNPAGLPTAVYTLTYHTTSFPNPALCPDSTLLPISVLNPQVSSINQAGPFCSADSPFQLSVSANTGSFVPTFYLSSTGLFNPSLAGIGPNTVQYVVGTSTCNVSNTRLISVEAFVPPTIINSIPDQCNTNQVVNLLGATSNNSGTWSGPGVLGASFNPAVSGTGAIILMYSTSSVPSGLCPASQTMAINVYSLAAPAITRAGPYCDSHEPVQLKVSPLGGVFGSSTGAISVSGWFNPAYAAIGDNIINYSVTAGPCVSYTQAIVKIEKFISADFSKYAGPFCKNDLPLDLDGIVQNIGGSFAGPGVIGSIFTPGNANIGNNNIIIYQTHSQTLDLCPDTSAMRIQVNDVPVVSVVRDVDHGCNPVTVVFNTPNANTGRGVWTLGDGSDPLDGLTVSHTYTTAGTYSVVFNYWDNIGCSTQTVLTDAVTVFEVPKTDFSYTPYDDITLADPQVQFLNHTQNLGNNTYQWQIADLYSLSDVNPTVIFPKAGEYRISLIATTIDGCKDETDKILTVRPDFNVFIPNSFTPNFDGLNDVFIPVFSSYGVDTKTFEMEIFDRWGTSLFHSKDITKGWDGTQQNKGTEPLKQDVYVYRIKYKDQEGKIYNKTGNVTLLK